MRSMSDTSQEARLSTIQNIKAPESKYRAALEGIKEICTDIHYLSHSVKFLVAELVNAALGIEDARDGFIRDVDVNPQLGVKHVFSDPWLFIDAPEFEAPTSWTRDDDGRLKVKIGTERHRDIVKWFKDKGVVIPLSAPQEVKTHPVDKPKQETNEKKMTTTTDTPTVRVGIEGMAKGAQIQADDRTYEVKTIGSDGTVNAGIPGQRGRPRVFKIAELTNNNGVWTLNK